MTTKERSRIAASISAVAAIWLSAPTPVQAREARFGVGTWPKVSATMLERNEPERQAEEEADVRRTDGAELAGQPLPLCGVAETLAGGAERVKTTQSHERRNGKPYPPCRVPWVGCAAGRALKDLEGMSIRSSIGAAHPACASGRAAKMPGGQKERPRRGGNRRPKSREGMPFLMVLL